MKPHHTPYQEPDVKRWSLDEVVASLHASWEKHKGVIHVVRPEPKKKKRKFLWFNTKS